MVTYDWGIDQPPHPSAADQEERIDAEPARLPHVQRLVEQGWELAPEAPMLAFIPAVWPARLRTWIPDLSTRYEQRWTTNPATGDSRSFTAQSSTAAVDEVENDTDALLADAGILGRPRGRIWLLKPPAGFASLDAFLQHVGQQADAAGIGGELSQAYVGLTIRCLTESSQNEPASDDETRGRGQPST